MRKSIIHGVLFSVIVTIVGCGKEESEEQRIIKEFNTFSVHLYAGMKLIYANPDNDPEIAKAKKSFHEILENNVKEGASVNIGFADISRLAKLAYEVKSLGEVEVSLGRNNKKLYLINTKEADEKVHYITSANDHAITLGMLFAAKLSPGAVIPVSNKAMLYEAWMSEGINTSDRGLDGMLLSVQAATYAENGYCELGDAKTEKLRGIEIKKLDPLALAFISVASSNTRATIHVGKENIIRMFFPQILEVLPGAARAYAHFQLGNCLSERGEEKRALIHQQFTIDAITTFGVPDSELAILKAGVAYKSKDYKQAALHLKKADESRLLDSRIKSDLKQLINELESEDSQLAKKYLSSAYFGIVIAKIVNQRLLDEDVYDELLKHPLFKAFLQMYEGLSKN